MKTLFLTIIALVIPLFFLLIFVLGTYNRLNTLRQRCRLPAGNGTNADHEANERHRRALEEYNAARLSFPTKVIASLFGFGPGPTTEPTSATSGAPRR